MRNKNSPMVPKSQARVTIRKWLAGEEISNDEIKLFYSSKIRYNHYRGIIDLADRGLTHLTRVERPRVNHFYRKAALATKFYKEFV